jgi:hypothetical protein
MKEYKAPKNYNWQYGSDPYIKKYVASLRQSASTNTSGTLVVGREYLIDALVLGDDFTNVGFVTAGVPFTATGTTPTDWTNGTAVIDVEASAPQATVLVNETGVSFSFVYDSPGVYYIIADKDVFLDQDKVQLSVSNSTFFTSGPGGHNIIAFPFFVPFAAVMLSTDVITGDFVDDTLGAATQNLLEITIYP